MKYLYQNKHWALNKEYNLDKLLYLMIDRPNYISNPNDFVWRNDIKQLYRDYDLPANIIGEYLYWFDDNGYFHREKNKPSVIYRNDGKEYWTNGKYIKSDWSK